MSRNNERNRDARVYIGNLPSDVRQKELESLFDKYGKITSIDLKNGAGRGPPFAFIEFEDYRDAEDAIRGKNGYNFDGYSLRVEMPHGGKGSGPPPPRGRGPPSRYDDRYSRGYDRGYGGGGGNYGRDRYDGGYDRGYSRGGGYDRDRHDRGSDMSRRSLSSRKTKFRVTISGLPEDCNWKDLKDHMREAGEVIYADVRGAAGIVEYESVKDMKWALEKLDDTEIRTRDGTKAYITVKEEKRSSSRSRSRSAKRRSASTDRKRSASPGRKRSQSRSPSRKSSRSPNRNGSASPVRKRSASPGRKRSASPGRKRSASPGRKRSASPGRKRSASPGRKRSASPGRKRSASPERRDSPPAKKSPRRSSSHSRSPSQ